MKNFIPFILFFVFAVNSYAAPTVYVSNRANGTPGVYKIESGSNQAVQIFNLPGKDITYVTTYQRDNLLVVDCYNELIYAIDTSGALLWAEPVNVPSANALTGIVEGKDGNIYVTSYHEVPNRIYQVNVSNPSSPVITAPWTNLGGGAYGLVQGKGDNDNLYMISHQGGLYEIDITGGWTKIGTTRSTTLTIDNQNNLYFGANTQSYGYTDSILKYNIDTQDTTVWWSTSPQNNFALNSLFFDPVTESFVGLGYDYSDTKIKMYEFDIDGLLTFSQEIIGLQTLAYTELTTTGWSGSDPVNNAVPESLSVSLLITGLFSLTASKIRRKKNNAGSRFILENLK